MWRESFIPRNRYKKLRIRKLQANDDENMWKFRHILTQYGNNEQVGRKRLVQKHS